MDKTDDLEKKLCLLAEKNEKLKQENEKLQNILNSFSPMDYSKFYSLQNFWQPEDSLPTLSGNNFWNTPLEPWWGKKKPQRYIGILGDSFPNYSFDVPMAAESEPEPYGQMTKDEEKRMTEKVAELEDIIETMRKKLEGISEPLGLVAESIKKKAMFVNVSSAYKLLTEMNSVFMGYEPWKKIVQPLESYLLKMKDRELHSSSEYTYIPTDEELAAAICKINGKGKVLDDRQKWMGVCSYVQSNFDYPRDLSSCCEKLAELPYPEELEIPCNYANVRKLAIYNFTQEDYRHWSRYKPNKTEKKHFDSCFDVGKKLEKVLEL